ncbi:hypothetical protein GF318_03070 [Candidatus Micrarchaeota archaeon]|nr:hypothetical protein [Candidatus Micrarchaeota archaeon]
MPLINEFWDPWIWFGYGSLGLATILVSLVYVLSGFLMNDRMKTWAKMELTEILYSAIIIVLALSAVKTVDAVVQGSLGVSNVPAVGTPASCYAPGETTAFVPTRDTGVFGSATYYRCLNICGDGIANDPDSIYHNIDSCHMRLGVWYLREIFDEAKDFAFNIYIDYIYTSMIAEFTINIEFLFEKAGFFTFNPWRGFFTMENTVKEQVFDWTMKIMTLTKFQEVMLHFISMALFPAMFVTGVILRTFTFTRRLGGLLLAMAIALYFIFPAFYAFGALVMLDIKGQAYEDWINNAEANPQGTDNPNPPVANTMYLAGDFAVMGGDFSTREAVDELRYFEGQSPDDHLRYMEQGDARYIPRFDLSTDEYSDESGLTQEEVDELQSNALESAREAGDSWFDKVSRRGKDSDFITFAWERNGPVETLSRITFWSLFFSLFSIIGTIAAIRSLSITFGGDIEIAGLTRLI